MKKILFAVLCLLPAFASGINKKDKAKDVWPDGTPMDAWFHDIEPTDINKLGKHYRITDHGVVQDSTVLQTEKIQAIIDKAHEAGGGVIIIPEGVYLSGSLFFKQGTHLHVVEGGKLKGSDDISHFELLMTRIEGQTRKYFAALVNADGLDGFTISGKGAIDGNGLRYWKAFWLRRAFNPQCTNVDEMRPRLVYISNSKNVQLSGVHLMNSPFWTTHYYKCENVKLLGLTITSPAAPVKAPSSDAVDIDACRNFLIKDCYMSVNDDAVALKGGKGVDADTDPDNGGNYHILIEDCTFGFCHGALTFGSESVHNKNIIMRRIQINHAQRLFWLKMRPDTPQNYEHVLIEDIEGSHVGNFLYIRPWTQFFDLGEGRDVIMSYASNITMRNINLECNTVFRVDTQDPRGAIDAFDFRLSNFTFENLDLKAKDPQINEHLVDGFIMKNVVVNGEKVKK
ncbi:rhamnogalacturonidase [Geofilum rubicundum]|uniref:Exopolygalacturonase n=1 Tax=Geofilum rubicundum JCM 15548 TaxID=1236989 RepID=A0A0E9LW47_9BACT|nr:glycosyl hydrolase family 28 protein [Geofilum rubicundum]GAO29454.1 exopolygalacturonase precursor [Geofilum rubicundum JCM 15548]